MEEITLEKVTNKAAPRAKERAFLHVKRSPIQGLGLFTSKDIPAYDIICSISGKKVYRPYQPAYASLNPNWLGIGYQEWLEMDADDIAVFANHSCSPNILIDEHLQVFALRQIKEGEELLLDYSTTELDPYWSMKCSCGEACCRKTLLSFQYLPLELQNEYSRFLASPFLKHATVTH
jgi:SET domain-containing protein